MPITDMHVQMKAFVSLGGPGVGGGWEEEQCRPVHNSCSYIDKQSDDEQSEADSLLLQR